jgi:hypothetical protein
MATAVKKTGTEVRNESVKRLSERYALPAKMIKDSIGMTLPSGGGMGASVEIYGSEKRIPARKYKTKEITVRKGNRTYKGFEAKFLKKGGFKYIKGGFLMGKSLIIERKLKDIRPKSHRPPGESEERVFKSSYKTQAFWGPSFIRYLTERRRFKEMANFARQSLEKNVTIAAEKLIAKFAG